jgi:hypothetical protein
LQQTEFLFLNLGFVAQFTNIIIKVMQKYMQHNLVNPYIVALNTAMTGDSKALEDGDIQNILTLTKLNNEQYTLQVMTAPDSHGQLVHKIRMEYDDGEGIRQIDFSYETQLLRARIDRSDYFTLLFEEKLYPVRFEKITEKLENQFDKFMRWKQDHVDNKHDLNRVIHFI